MKMKSALPGLLVIQILLSACSGMLSSDQPAQQTYLLEPVTLSTAISASEAAPPALTLTLRAVPGLDTDRIQALDADARLIQYANARWPDFLPEVLTSVVRRSLLSSGRFATITTGSRVVPNSWELDLEVRQFYGIQQIRGTTERVSVYFGGSLRCGEQTHRIELTSSVPVSEERLSVVVKAHQQALDEVTRQLWARIESGCTP
jgi:ABC-type uncharacterized transport system auxiliary subunit